MTDSTNKVIFIDNGHYLHSPGFFWMDNAKVKLYMQRNNIPLDTFDVLRRNRDKVREIKGMISDDELDYEDCKKVQLPFTYTVLSMIIGDLKKIGVNENDTVILGIDARSSWRKEFEPEYKGERRKLMSELYEEYDWLLDCLDRGTNWNLIKIDHLEYDDIAAVGCKYFKDQECIILSMDSDLEQCWSYPNTKIFSPHPKKKMYKIKPKKFNVHDFILKKTNKEVSDNLNTTPGDERTLDNRIKCISLIDLPPWVEEKIITELDRLVDKPLRLEEIPYPNLRERFMDIYSDKGIVTYEQSVKKIERKKAKKKKAKTK